MASRTRDPMGSRPDRRVPYLGEVSIEALLGSVVISWNNFEALCRELLKELSGNAPPVDALTAELGGMLLYNALRAVSRVSGAPELRDAIDELAEAFDRLREHRNYYIHGASSASDQHLALRDKTAKTKICVFEDEISKEEIYLVSADCEELALFAFEMWSYLRLKRQDRQTEWRSMPFLPPKLAKNHRR